MDLWSVIPIGVHQYTILSTMVSSISLGNILWKDTTCKDLLGNESYLVISFHHSILQLAYITQAWIFWILELVPCKQTYEMHIQMHHTSSWVCPSYLCAQNFSWSLSFFISLPLCHMSRDIYVSFPFSLSLFLSPTSLFLSPFVINDHKGSKCR